MSGSPAPFVAQVDAILAMSDDMRFELPQLRVPTLVITGSQDSLTPVGDAEELAELITGSQLYVLRGAAHGLMAEAPGPFNRTVVSFIADVDRAEEARAPRVSVRRSGSAAAGGTRATT
jgi:pimeloyl-ACP methyl ester carboxylesterase